MSASFVAGANRIFNAAEPRFVLLHGDEYALRERLVVACISKDYETYHFDGRSFRPIEAFIAAHRASKHKLVHVTHAEALKSWDWLPRWFNKVKGVRLLLETDDITLAQTLEHKANTRGLVIDCSSPKTPAAREKTLKIVTSWYSFSTSQVNLLLNQNGWKLTQCLELLDKLTLLNLPLNSDTIVMLGITSDPHEEFVSALQEDQVARALTVAPRVEDSKRVIAELSDWLDKLARVKFSQGFLKPAHEVALEVGLDRKTVEFLQKQGRKFDLTKINRAAVALANADRDVTKGHTNGALEVMVNSW